MKVWIRRLFILIIMIIFLVAFSGSYSALSIDNLSTVVAIAIDTSNINKLRMSFQFTNASSVSESGSTEQSPSIIYSIDCSSISNGINLMNTYIGKELNLSHCKIIAFSEELAMNGISEEVYTLFNNAQIRPSTNVVITKCTAKYYLENSKPLAENLLTKHYEIFSNSSKSTGYTVNATLGEFFSSLICDACEGYAILGGVSSENNEGTTGIDSQKDSSNKANSSSLTGKTTSENIGLAVFKGDKLVGELNSIETLSFLATRNEISSFLVSVPDPNDSNSYIDIYLTPIIDSRIDVDIVNGSPYIKVSYSFTGRIYSMKADSDYLDDEVLDKISDSCSNYLKTVFSNYLYKTSKDLQSDINGFGKNAKSKFLTTQDFENYNWLEHYSDSFFDVSVDASIRSSYLLTET